jgi:hypothetical protein
MVPVLLSLPLPGQRFVRRHRVRVDPLFEFIFEADKFCQTFQIFGRRTRKITWQSCFPVPIGNVVSDLFHHFRLFVSPAVECAGPYESDVSAEISVAAAAVDAEEDTEGGGSPSWVF